MRVSVCASEGTHQFCEVETSGLLSLLGKQISRQGRTMEQCCVCALPMNAYLNC
ncbi:hypothetical protein DAI22_05g218400 [Oryza sativa Japonica Group]|nr:hypothetical protein DAI22_05g218400 [Oryza sativa Japonica Group]